MDVKALATEFVANCNSGRELHGLETLYADHAVSVEAYPNPQTGTAVTEGRDGIRGKHAWWAATFETHSMKATGPYMHGDDRFAVVFHATATEKASGQQSEMNEVAIYTVDDGKIVREEFFYTM